MDSFMVEAFIVVLGSVEDFNLLIIDLNNLNQGWVVSSIQVDVYDAYNFILEVNNESFEISIYFANNFVDCGMRRW